MADTVRIDEAAQAAIAAYAEQHTVSLSRAASELIGRNDPPAVQQREVSLDAAAEVLLRHLPPSLVERLRDLCREYRTSPAAYLLSYAKIADDRGELGIFISPDDINLGTALAPEQVAPSATCAHCKSPFTPTRAGQRYCPEPEDWSKLSCGRLALLDELHKKRPPEAQRKSAESRQTEKTLR